MRHPSIHDNGYDPGGKKSDSEGLVTVGRVFQLNSLGVGDHEKFITSKHPYWRDTCLSLALAKMLRRRFARLPLDEAGCRKALDFVLEGLIGCIGSNKDGSTGERNPTKGVFHIIQEELKLVYEFLRIKVPVYHYYNWYVLVDLVGAAIVACIIGIYLALLANKGSIWTPQLSLEEEKKYSHCFFFGIYAVVIFSKLDIAITCLLYVACTYIQLAGFMTAIRKRWFILCYVKRIVKGSDRCTDLIFIRLVFPLANIIKNILKPRGERVKKVREHCSVFDTKTHTILFYLKVNVSILARFTKWTRRKIPRVIPDVCQSTNHVQEAILNSLRSSHGRLTNGETLLRRHGMGYDVNWACQPNSNRSTTEDILVWHIATTLLHHQESQSLSQQNSDTHQELSIQQKTKREVALELSSYCHHLVAHLPELLPVDVDRTKDMYEHVIKEILAMDRSASHRPTRENRCNVALQAASDERSVVGRGARLARALMNYAENGKPVYWTMLADFWVEMMLYIAPSDNVEAHAEILERGELITQLWALLTHAGILTWPKPTEHGDHVRENNEIAGDMNV
jgi:Protein of unknown function, DUF594/Domain of unknown function (DUF4220)